MKLKFLLLLSLFIVYSSSSVWAQTPIEFPEKPLRLVAESAKDTCPICAKQTLEKAFLLLEEQFFAGNTFVTTGSCRLVRSTSSGENELVLFCDAPGKESLPLLIFRFHTSSSHLVGISSADYTEEGVAREYLSAPPGTVFEGTLETILFRYGDGTTFSYSAGRRAIQVHCRLLMLKRRSP